MSAVLTYDADAHQDGPGAQYLRSVSLLAIAEANQLGYLYTPPKAFKLEALVSDGSFYRQDLSSTLDSWETFLNLAGLPSPAQTWLQEIRIRDLELQPWPAQTLIRAAYPWPVWRDKADWLAGVSAKLRALYYQTPKPDSGFDSEFFNIAVHVRRGDVDQCNPAYTPNDYYTEAIAQILAAARDKPTRVHLFSQRPLVGSSEDPREIVEGLPEVEVHLDADPLTTFHRFVEADVLIPAVSSFSYLAAVYRLGPVWHTDSGLPPLTSWRALQSVTGQHQSGSRFLLPARDK